MKVLSPKFGCILYAVSERTPQGSGLSGLTPRGLRGWGFFDSICDMTLLIRPPNFFNKAENNKTNIFRKRRFCTFIWCNELIHVSYRKNMKNPER